MAFALICHQSGIEGGLVGFSGWSAGAAGRELAWECLLPSPYVREGWAGVTSIPPSDQPESINSAIIAQGWHQAGAWNMKGGLEFEAAVALLESSADYRVLRRLVPREATGLLPSDDNIKAGVFLDVETTGLDPDRDEIIELGMVRFSFSPEGEVLATDPPFSRLRQPSKPIPAEITRLTGITDEMVAGKAIDAAEVESFIEPAVIVIAHNARFDRRFVERAFPIFAKKAWGCSISDVPWREEGFEGSRLAYLAMRHGFFFDGHRATDDCHAALEILARALPVSGELALKRLLDTARQPSFRLWAIDSPFETKDILKARGYRWNAGENGNPKSWYIDLSEDGMEAELAFLKDKVFNRDPDPRIDRVTAFDRYSDRG